MRTILFALLVAALTFGIHGPLAGAVGPGGLPDGGPEWLFWGRLALVAAAAVGILAAYRIRSGLLGPGLAAALALCAGPSIPDAVASPFALPRLAILVLLALLVLLAAWRFRGSAERRARLPFLVAGGAALVIVVVSPSGAFEFGAEALGPPVAAALAFAVLAGEVALLLARRGGPESPARRALVAGLAVVILGSAVLGQVRALAWRTAPAFWERAVGESPRSPAALGALAGALAEAGDGAAAVGSLRSFAESVAAGGGRGFAEEARLRGARGVAAAARRLFEGGPPADPRAAEAVEASLRAAREFAPGSAPVLVALAEVRLAAGDFLEPIRLLEEAVSRDRADAGAWDALARAELLAGRVPEALEAARTATGLRPVEKGFVVTWAGALMAAGRGGEAVEILFGALGTKPPYDSRVARAYAEVQLRLAREDVSAGRPGPARRKLLSASQFYRGDAACADLLAELDRRMEAERPEHEKLMARRPDGTVDPNDWLLYTVWLCRWGEFEKAEPSFNRMRELRGTTAKVHFYYGLEFWEGRGSAEGVENAVKAYQQAVALDPGYAAAWNRLWQCQRLLGRIADAREAARRFYELAPADPDAAAAQQFLEGK